MTQDEVWLLREKYQGVKTDAFFEDCARLKNGEPLAYIIGSIPFLNTTIFLDAHPLIPRPETEFWVEKAIAHMNVRAPLRILDLCAGSGCIGVAVLTARKEARVDFGEIDTRLHPTIHKNIVENDIDPSRTRIFGGTLFTELTDTYDYILSNPPYIDKTLGRVAPEVSRYEPALALYGGEEGTYIITQIITDMSPFLSPIGVLYLEHEPEHVAHISHTASTQGYLSETYPDQYGVPRYTVITRKTPQNVQKLS